MGSHSDFKNNSQDINTSNVNLYYFKNITKNSYAYYDIDNTFSVIKSIDNILLLIYSNKKKSIISLNLINYQIITEIKNAHNNFITNFRHYLDNINKRDLILSISLLDNNIKLWNLKNWNCLLDIKNINNGGELYSACFLNDNNKIYILTSNSNIYWKRDGNEFIKVYNFNGNKIKEINDSCDRIVYIDNYYDKKSSKNYIITGNYGYVKSYDYNKNKLYHKYLSKYSGKHFSIIVKYIEKNIKLIESSCDNFDGFIRIWNFHSGKLLNKIKPISKELYGICLWDNRHLFVGDQLRNIILMDILEKKTIKIFKGHENNVLTLKKINHPL